MPSLFKYGFLLGSQALARSVMHSCSEDQVTLEATACSTVAPSGFWQIYQQDQQRSTNLFPLAPNGSAEFFVSQGPKATNKLDLIVSFTNVPCPPAGSGPYQIEFQYSNPARAGYGASGNQLIDMFAIKGALPTQKIGDTTNPFPTWNNMGPLTGDMKGTFHLPNTDSGDDPTKAKTIFINSPVCQSTTNLRFSITTSNQNEGFVRYLQDNDPIFFVPGLRIRYGC